MACTIFDLFFVPFLSKELYTVSQPMHSLEVCSSSPRKADTRPCKSWLTENAAARFPYRIPNLTSQHRPGIAGRCRPGPPCCRRGQFRRRVCYVLSAVATVANRGHFRLEPRLSRPPPQPPSVPPLRLAGASSTSTASLSGGTGASGSGEKEGSAERLCGSARGWRRREEVPSSPSSASFTGAHRARPTDRAHREHKVVSRLG